MRRFLCVAVAAAALAASPAHAHHTWLSWDAASGDIVMLWGHPGHDPEGPNKYSVVELNAIGADGGRTSLVTKLEKKGAPLAVAMPEGKPYAVFGFTDNGFMVDTKDRKYIRTNKLVVKNAVRSIWSRQFAKMLLPGAGAAVYAKPLGELIEIVPLSDPYALKTGEKLKVKVLFQGRPVAGARLGIDNGVDDNPDRTKYETGKNGVAAVPLFPKQTVIGVYHRTEGTVRPLADQDSLAATLCIAGLE